MKMTSKCAIAALALVGAAGAASAQTVSFSRNGAAFQGSGGEFNSTFTGGVLNGRSFMTFCLELNENIALGGTQYTYSIDTLGFGASAGGNNGGSPDPVSEATAWLFSQWRNAGGVFTATNANAGALQKAIWHLEGEQNNGGDGAVVTLLNLAAAAIGYTPVFNDPNDAVDSTNFSFGNMFVLNPVAPNGDLAQSQLIIIPLPTASGMALAGLALVGGIRRRK